MKQEIPHYSFADLSQKESLASFLEWENELAGRLDLPHAYEFHTILVFEKGGGTHFMNFDRREVCDHTFHILPKNQVHQLQKAKTSKGFVIAVSDTFVTRLQQFDPSTNYRQLFYDAREISLSAQDFAQYAVYFREAKENKDNPSWFLNVIATILLRLVQNRQNISTPKTDSSFAANLLKLLEDNVAQRPSLKYYADRLNMNAILLNRETKKYFGKTVLKIRDDLLITRIKTLLYSTNDSIKEIAYDLNFEDESHFCKFFKNHVKLTPSQFRKNVQ
jgi:AraC family transcriptional activator of pobA